MNENKIHEIITQIEDNITCLEAITETTKKIAELNPSRFFFKDPSFKDDATKVNCDEYLNNKLPGTIVKVI
jgi:hypothetical protein